MPGAKGSPAPNAPLALWIGGQENKIDVHVRQTRFTLFVVIVITGDESTAVLMRADAKWRPPGKFKSTTQAPGRSPMGEAKKKLMIACRCGSGAPAGQCCLTSRGWHKRPELIKVRNTGHSGSHASCYLNATGACSSKISGEHLVSHGILKLLAKKKMVISGLPWLKGAKKLVGFTSMTTNCLCTTHNSALSPLDLVGVRLFEAVRKCQTHKSGTGQRYLFSGHDIERWQFKTFMAFSVSKNLGIRGVAPERRVEPNIAFADFLEDVERWKRPLGMYLFHKMGRTFKRKDTFGFGPVVALKSNEIVGMLTAIQGIHMGLLATDRFPEIAATSYKGVYRPGSLIFRLGKVTHRIQLSWEDGLQHPDITMILRNTR